MLSKNKRIGVIVMQCIFVFLKIVNSEIHILFLGICDYAKKKIKKQYFKTFASFS